MLNKQELRKEMRLRKRQFTSEQLEKLSLASIGKLLQHPRILQAHCIMLYASLPDEVNTHHAIQQLLQEGKTILLPVVTGEGSMVLRTTSPNDPMQEGAFHIYEPTGALFTHYNQIEVAVIPGMAFDTKGQRLGRGKGYYDRFLPHLSPDIYIIGVCFPFQLLEEIPTEEHDKKVNIVIPNS